MGRCGGLGALQQTLKGHSSSVRAVAVSLDGKLLASASSDKTIKLMGRWLGERQAADAQGPFGVGSAPWPSRRTARCWRRLRATRRSSCGTPGRARCGRRSRAIRTRSRPWPSRVRSGPWPSRRTASCWCRLQTTRPSRYGTPARERYSRRSRLAIPSILCPSPITVHVSGLTGDRCLFQ